MAAMDVSSATPWNQGWTNQIRKLGATTLTIRQAV
jgi:hypothetical protein